MRQMALLKAGAFALADMTALQMNVRYWTKADM